MPIWKGEDDAVVYCVSLEDAVKELRKVYNLVSEPVWLEGSKNRGSSGSLYVVDIDISKTEARQKDNLPIIKKDKDVSNIKLSYMFACTKARRILSKLPENQVEFLEGGNDIAKVLNYMERYVVD